MGKGLKSGGRDGNLIGLEREEYGFSLEVSDSLEHWRPLNFSLGLCSSGHTAVGAPGREVGSHKLAKLSRLQECRCPADAMESWSVAGFLFCGCGGPAQPALLFLL